MTRYSNSRRRTSRSYAAPVAERRASFREGEAEGEAAGEMAGEEMGGEGELALERVEEKAVCTDRKVKGGLSAPARRDMSAFVVGKNGKSRSSHWGW